MGLAFQVGLGRLRRLCTCTRTLCPHCTDYSFKDTTKKLSLLKIAHFLKIIFKLINNNNNNNNNNIGTSASMY